MTQTQQWRAIAVYRRPATVTEDELDRLTQALPGYGIVVGDATTLRLEMTVEAATIRLAADEVLRRGGRAAWRAAFGVDADPVQLRLLTEEEHLREIAHPAHLDLVGITEIADMLEVTPQRAQQLVELPDFPAPVDEIAAGRVYTRPSVQRWCQTWQRRAGAPKSPDRQLVDDALRLVLDHAPLERVDRARVEKALAGRGARYLKGKYLVLSQMLRSYGKDLAHLGLAEEDSRRIVTADERGRQLYPDHGDGLPTS